MDERKETEMTEQTLAEAVREAKEREAQHPHRVEGEYHRPDEPGLSDRWLVRCHCGKAFRGSTRNIAFGGYHRHRDRVRNEEQGR